MVERSDSFFLGDRNRTLDEQLSKFESYLMRVKVSFYESAWKGLSKIIHKSCTGTAI